MIKSDLISFDLTKDVCFVCGEPATTVEHVIPKWLQKKFNLWDKKIEIPNLTSITYKQIVIPACKKCNNEVFGKLENRIKKNTADDKDIWRWANKIHFGLRFKDKFLEFDRAKPGIKIDDVFQSLDYLEHSRHFLHCITNKFSCEPDPFGSVFKFEFEKEYPFDLIHIISTSSIFICVGKQVYIVFIKDGQLLKKDDRGFSINHSELMSKGPEIQDALFFYAQCIYYFEQFTYSNPIMFTGNAILKLGRATLRAEKPLDKELFRSICARFRITWIDPETLMN